MNIYLKSLFYLAIFSILHFGYDLTHWVFLAPFCVINESVFQHLKMAFWAYLLTSVLEYFVIKEKISKRTLFLVSQGSNYSNTTLVYYAYLVFSPCDIWKDQIFAIRSSMVYPQHIFFCSYGWNNGEEY